MPRKGAMRDTVSAVRSRLPHLSNMPREKIELALLYYDSNIDETVEAFKRDGAVEALSGWTEMTHDRGHNGNKRANNKSANRTNKPPSSQTPPSNGLLRPSQRVSNIFQTFADGGVPTTATNPATNGNGTMSNVSFLEHSNSSLQSYPSDDLSFHPLLSQDSTTNNLLSSSNGIQIGEDDFHDTSNVTTNSSVPGDEVSHHVNGDESIDLTNGHHVTANRLETGRNRQDSISSNHDRPSITTDIELATNGSHASSTTPATKTVIKSSPSFSSTTPFSDNRKALTKSAKDLQRQTSTLSNVEMSFENEIKSSVKRIDEAFKQIRAIIQEREVELYLEMDKVKEQGLTVIHRRQQRAIELRQRMDGCDRLEPTEIDHLRTDVKQFVTDRRYDLGEELTSSHRFEYDQTVIETLKHFGSVLRIDRPRTRSTSSALIDTNGAATDKPTTADKSPETLSTPSSTGRSISTAASSSNDQQQQKPLPQRMNHRQHFNGYHASDQQSNSYSNAQTNGYHHYYDEQNAYQTVNRRRPAPSTQQQQPQQQQQQQYPPHPNGNPRRPRPTPSSNNNRRNGVQNSETTNTYRRPRPPQSMASPVPPISN